MFARGPRRVEALLNLRNLINERFGLKTSGDGRACDRRHDRDISCYGEPFFGQDRVDLPIWRMESKGLNRRGA
jgi:hypothetical protein